MELVGRRSSLFTRVPLLFAGHLGVELEFTVVPDMTRLEASAYADNPALKLPILRDGGTTVFGAQNIARVVAERATASGRQARILWPEALTDARSRNAQELVAHAMAAQVQLVIGTVIAKLPADNVFFVKARAGLQGALAWLGQQVDACVASLPADRDLSYFEVSLFCLVEHLRFRATVPLDALSKLQAFAEAFGRLPAARSTGYRFDG